MRRLHLAPLLVRCPVPTGGFNSNHEGQRLLGYCTGEDETTDGVHAWKAEDQGKYGLGHETARSHRRREEGVWPEAVKLWTNGRCDLSTTHLVRREILLPDRKNSKLLGFQCVNDS